ncbi:contactin-associated protein-like 2 [Branchiostoma floridae]|uniref:Contactin-associated protein-like 2 n=2 Tax=Branchiostoma floridae TaxID=7739 RepID=A0A9J7KTM7_BRAFL|nr:contactin-associated protein-like 2 [Branchiostoma floridae]
MSPYGCNCLLLVKFVIISALISPQVSSQQASCLATRLSGAEDSGSYTLDVDGQEGPLAEFDVYCDFSGLDTMTVLHHSSEDRIRVSSGGDFHLQVAYPEGSLEQIQVVVQKSSSCKQFLRYECRNSPLRLAENVFWWETTANSRVYSWGGAGGKLGQCLCGTQHNCQPSPEQSCNCDANDTVWRTDEGYLTDKTTLPVVNVSLTAREGQGYLTVGPLICVDVPEFIPNQPWQIVLGTAILVFAAFLTFMPAFVRKW